MSDTNTKALKSGFWYVLSNLMLRGIALITTPIFARMLTHEQFGEYSNFSSWTNIAVILITMRMESSLISAKFDFKDNLSTYNRSLLILTALITAIWTVVTNLFGRSFKNIFGFSQLYINLMLLYCFFHAVINIFQINERYAYRYKRSVYVALITTLSSTLLSILLVATMHEKLTGRIMGHVFPTAIIGMILLFYFFSENKRIDTRVWIYALKICLPFIPHLLSLQLLNSVDRIMITRICGSTDNALYTIAYSCGHIVTLLMTSMNGAFAPWLGDKLNDGSDNEIKKVSKYYILLFSAVAVIMMLLGPEILMIMGGKSYLDAKYVMPPVAMGCVCQFLYTLYVNVEQFKKKTVGMAVASVIAALMNYGLNAIFIPMYGYIAAAYTTLAGYLFLLGAHMFIVHQLGEAKIYNTKYILLITIGMMIITLLINILYGHQIVRYIVIGVSLSVFAAVVYFRRTLIGGLIKKIVK